MGKCANYAGTHPDVNALSIASALSKLVQVRWQGGAECQLGAACELEWQTTHCWKAASALGMVQATVSGLVHLSQQWLRLGVQPVQACRPVHLEAAVTQAACPLTVAHPLKMMLAPGWQSCC